jgi:hypothetical protein
MAISADQQTTIAELTLPSSGNGQDVLHSVLGSEPFEQVSPSPRLESGDGSCVKLLQVVGVDLECRDSRRKLTSGARHVLDGNSGRIDVDWMNHIIQYSTSTCMWFAEPNPSHTVATHAYTTLPCAVPSLLALRVTIGERDTARPILFDTGLYVGSRSAPVPIDRSPVQATHA